MADGTADAAKMEQLVTCIRRIDDQVNTHEEFVGLHPIPEFIADTIVSVLKVSFEVFQLLRKLDDR